MLKSRTNLVKYTTELDTMLNNLEPTWFYELTAELEDLLHNLEQTW
jgi:hypothetical protein